MEVIEEVVNNRNAVSQVVVHAALRAWADSQLYMMCMSHLVCVCVCVECVREKREREMDG